MYDVVTGHFSSVFLLFPSHLCEYANVFALAPPPPLVNKFKKNKRNRKPAIRKRLSVKDQMLSVLDIGSRFVTFRTRWIVGCLCIYTLPRNVVACLLLALFQLTLLVESRLAASPVSRSRRRCYLTWARTLQRGTSLFQSQGKHRSCTEKFGSRIQDPTSRTGRRGGWIREFQFFARVLPLLQARLKPTPRRS